MYDVSAVGHTAAHAGVLEKEVFVNGGDGVYNDIEWQFKFNVKINKEKYKKLLK